ncbi:MAG: RIP metalloprotease RseP [Actinomycetota bacterium]|nr:RIP metalloprotease RseP [Actinomycetota bacterium]
MTILLAVVGLSALVVIHELGHMLAAKTMGVKVTEFGFGFGPPLLKKKIGKTAYSIRIILLGGFVKMAGMNDEEEGPESYRSKVAWRRAFIIIAGPFANLLTAVLILAALYISGVPTGVTTEVEEVVPGSLAAEAGVQGGDHIVSVDGEEVESWRQFQELASNRQPGDEVELVVERNGERERFSGMLTADPENPERAIVGVRPVVVKTSYGPLEALELGVERTVEIIGLFGWFIGQLITGKVSFYDSVSSPIGVVGVSSDVASQGAQSFAQLLALISINLAIFNLLPILPLDGGHLFFIAAEKVLGRPVSAETVGKIAAFGLALILMMFVFATYADLSKIFTGQPFIPREGP